MLFSYNSVMIKINFISNQYFLSIFICIFINRLHPIWNWFKWFLICDIINYNYSISLFIEIRCYVIKSFLACSVQYFQKDFISILQNNCFVCKVDSKGRHLIRRKLFCCIWIYHWCFTDRFITNNYYSHFFLIHSKF